MYLKLKELEEETRWWLELLKIIIQSHLLLRLLPVTMLSIMIVKNIHKLILINYNNMKLYNKIDLNQNQIHKICQI